MANALPIDFSAERKAVAVEKLREFHLDRFDRDLSDFQADALLEFILAEIGPDIYDQALEDARAFMFEKLEDLSVDLRKNGQSRRSER